MSIKDLTRNLKNKSFSSVYLLYGKETYILDHTQNMILNAALEQDNVDFNKSVYDMEETPVEIAIEDAETLPFMGEYRVVIIQNPYFLTATKSKAKLEHNLVRLEKYLADPAEQSIVILYASYEKLDERKKLVKLLKKQAEVVHADKMNEKTLKEWIQHAAQQEKVAITAEATNRLIELQGDDLGLLINEVKKMSVYVGESGQIERTTVDELISRSLESNVFTLVDHVVQRRIDQAFRITYDLLKQNEEPIKLMALLARQFRIILQVKQLRAQGYTENKIASAISVHPYAVKIASRQSNSFSEDELKRLLIMAADADFKMKTGQMDKTLTLELFITELGKPKQLI